MNISTWIAIYMPIYILFFVIIPQQQRVQRLVIKKNRKRKRLSIMTNDILKKYVGKRCKISTGSYGTSLSGKIISVNENWIEVETRKGMQVINAEFIHSINIL